MRKVFEGHNGVFRPCVVYDGVLNMTTVTLRDCSYVESGQDANGVSVLRDNYREGDIVGFRIPGRLVHYQ